MHMRWDFLPGRLHTLRACVRALNCVCVGVWVCMLCCLLVLVGVDGMGWCTISARKEIARCDQVSHVQTHHHEGSSIIS